MPARYRTVPLTSVGLLVVLGLALVLVVGLTVRSAWSGRRRRKIKAALGGLLALSLMVALSGAGVNRHFELYRSWHDLLGPDSADLVHAGTPEALRKATAPVGTGTGVPAHGTLLSLTIPATTSGLHVGGGYVYLPPQYRAAGFATTTFPVVQAFNGSPGEPVDWINGIKADTQLDAAIAAGQMAPAIVVFAPSNTSLLRSLECTDTADGLLDETYLTTDVRSWVSATFRTDGKRWTAMGYSTGGYCALSLAFRHPDLYARAISLDGYGAALTDRYARGLWKSPQDKLDHSPNWWVAHHPPEGIDVYLLHGSSDHEAAGDALAVWHALNDNKWWTPRSRLINEQHGRHTFAAWLEAFTPSLEWALPGSGAQVNTVAQEVPATPSPSPSPTPSPRPSAHPSATPRSTPAARGSATPYARPTPGPVRSSPGGSPAASPSEVAHDSTSPQASPSPSPSPLPVT